MRRPTVPCAAQGENEQPIRSRAVGGVNTGLRGAHARLPVPTLWRPGGGSAAGSVPAQVSPFGTSFRGLRRAAMEGSGENASESSSSAPGSEESARDPQAVPKKLCGYLSKFGGKGPIRGWKSRWFFYDERKCQLYYSRTAQDANPLDSIDLSNAVFDCKADAEEGIFEIETPSRIITLKVSSWKDFLLPSRCVVDTLADHLEGTQDEEAWNI
ncbi:hypothetical protein P7K49_001426 [Saguinus oedipus]|uniref:PH domain-containing protein n=1 Tax=Saguinus oedipus TaxID=9490 RepID=A0ABQ9WEX6_SAGOE|nr:hypothetical protein P7K49_001426 [Saguinus oedipus]